ncbi:hypothetical protein BKA80DRAFT_255859 [Phyllosticta citrichinensis]
MASSCSIASSPQRLCSQFNQSIHPHCSTNAKLVLQRGVLVSDPRHTEPCTCSAPQAVRRFWSCLWRMCIVHPDYVPHRHPIVNHAQPQLLDIYKIRPSPYGTAMAQSVCLGSWLSGVASSLRTGRRASLTTVTDGTALQLERLNPSLLPYPLAPPLLAGTY